MSESQVVPPFLTKPGQSPTPRSPIKQNKFLQIEPTVLKFNLSENGPQKRSLTLTNSSGIRVAWRIRVTVPTRFIVNPACGFLTSNEAQTVSVEIVDTKKYSKYHKFIVQAMEAKDDEKDRRKVWDDQRASKLSDMQTTRVFTEGIEGKSLVATLSDLSKSLICGSNTATSSTSATGTAVTTTASGSTSGSSVSSDASTASSASTNTEGSGVSSAPSTDASSVENVDEKIATFNAQAHGLSEQKKKVSKEMIELVNSIKEIEAELDRLSHDYAALCARNTELNENIAAMDKRSKQLDDDIKLLVNNKERDQMK